MNFQELRTNVEQWSHIRNIYTDGCEASQQAKAFEEIGELILALDKDDEKDIKDAIGDIAVCIINAAYLCAPTLFDDFGLKDYQPLEFGVRSNMRRLSGDLISGLYQWSLCRLVDVCYSLSLDINECFDQAWNEIKDRKGIMKNCKFVKWENMTEQEQGDYNIREHNRELLLR